LRNRHLYLTHYITCDSVHLPNKVLTGLEKLLGLTGNVYPDLVKVFFTNLKVHEDKLESRVKGIRMWVSSVKWLSVARIKCEGIKVGKGNIKELEEYNNITFYRSCLRNPQAIMRGFQVGGLT